MKKIIIKSICLAMLAALAFVNVNIALNGEKASKLSLKRVLALADTENPGVGENPGNGENGNDNCNNCGAVKPMDCKWTEVKYTIDAKGKQIEISRTVNTCTNCVSICNTDKSGNCSQPQLCPTSSSTEV